MSEQDIKICVIGLGYVGLPLARLFSSKYQTIGFDMNQARVDALMAGHDATLEVADDLLQSALANGFRCTTQLDDIRDCNFYVVAVPTPVDENNNPDSRPLWGASETVGKVIGKGDIVVYESTVYPGVTVGGTVAARKARARRRSDRAEPGVVIPKNFRIEIFLEYLKGLIAFAGVIEIHITDRRTVKLNRGQSGDILVSRPTPRGIGG